jgi:hypothetical protein
MTIRLEEKDYQMISYLAKRLVTVEIIAHKIGFRDESGIRKRAKRDKQLHDALYGNYDEGKIDLYVSQYQKSIDHHYTYCKVCHKIAEGEFFESCPYCDKEDPENKGKHTKVRHRLAEADTQMLIHMGKHHLGQTEKSLLEIQGNKDHPLAFENLTEEQIDEKLAKILPFLQKEYAGKA